MKRVQVIFQPGMRRLISQRFPNKNLLTATRELISGQLQQLQHWNNHHIVRHWKHLPPKPAPGNGLSDPKVTPGIKLGSPIEDVIQGLRDNCDDVTSPLIGIAAADEDTRRHSNEVSCRLIPAVFKYRRRVMDGLASTAGVSSDQFWDDFFDARHLISDVAQNDAHMAIHFFSGAVACLKHIGLVNSCRNIPETVPWQSLITDQPAAKLDVPLDLNDYNFLTGLKNQSSIGKEEICRELLFCALAGIPPGPLLTSIAEARWMNRHFRLLRRIEHEVIRPYARALQEEVQIPDHDTALAPFLEYLAREISNLHVSCQRVEMMLNAFIMARQNSDNHTDLLKLIQRAEKLHLIPREHVNFRDCKQLGEFLKTLGIDSGPCLS